MNSNDEIRPWRKVRDITLLILFWLTVSPLMLTVNSRKKYLKGGTMIWLIIFSPLAWTILSGLFLLFGLPLLTQMFPGVKSMLNSFPELNFTFNNPFSLQRLFLVSYFLPIYALCVGVLYAAMAFTGWSYREASVYICEYFEPWFCAFVAIWIIVWLVACMKKLNTKGKLLSAVLIMFEAYLAGHNAGIFFNRFTHYKGMSIDAIFKYVVEYLISLGEKTGTDYVTANIIVYIFPLMAILLGAYLGWVIHTLTKK
ncbi:MAG: hypothetical protein K2K81_03840 [Muribaculaceae bacterium]|nr:hypothetical protein [Muribaculaceae bacterium]